MGSPSGIASASRKLSAPEGVTLEMVWRGEGRMNKAFDRFTERARDVMRGAELEARKAPGLYAFKRPRV